MSWRAHAPADEESRLGFTSRRRGAALFARGVGKLFRQMFPGILALDALWAASPLLLFPKLGYLTLLFVAAMAFLPFTQRTLMRWMDDPNTATVDSH